MQILNWQLILNVGIVYQVTVCAEELPLYVFGAFLNKNNNKKLSAIFVHRNMEPDPKNMDMVKGILRSQLLIIYGGGKEGSQRWKTTDKATPLHCHSFQPPFIRAVNKEQKKMDFLLPSKRIKQ